MRVWLGRENRRVRPEAICRHGGFGHLLQTFLNETGPCCPCALWDEVALHLLRLGRRRINMHHSESPVDSSLVHTSTTLVLACAKGHVVPLWSGPPLSWGPSSFTTFCKNLSVNGESKTKKKMCWMCCGFTSDPTVTSPTARTHRLHKFLDTPLTVHVEQLTPEGRLQCTTGGLLRALEGPLLSRTILGRLLLVVFFHLQKVFEPPLILKWNYHV